ncbi:MAG: hypothetical protein QOJ78_463 [Pseudonocardiales bacterium]|nr:hypothetical protein [Pseudonocardiales bacterium]
MRTGRCHRVGVIEPGDVAARNVSSRAARDRTSCASARRAVRKGSSSPQMNRVGTSSRMPHRGRYICRNCAGWPLAQSPTSTSRRGRTAGRRTSRLLRRRADEIVTAVRDISDARERRGPAPGPRLLAGYAQAGAERSRLEVRSGRLAMPHTGGTRPANRIPVLTAAGARRRRYWRPGATEPARVSASTGLGRSAMSSVEAGRVGQAHGLSASSTR